MNVGGMGTGDPIGPVSDGLYIPGLASPIVMIVLVDEDWMLVLESVSCHRLQLQL